MQTNENFMFEVSLSLESFKDKTISNAMIGSTKKNPEFRKIRKMYGFDPRSGVSFIEQYVTPSELEYSLTHGHVTCPVFHPSTTKKDGSFGSYQKTNRNFSYSYFIGVDIDKTCYSTPEQFIEKLRLKPTLWYTSYSNMTWNEEKQYGGPRFRLIYVFDEMIAGRFYFRYCADKLNKIIEEDTGEEIADDCNLRCTQYFNGTDMSNPELYVNSGLTNIIYDLKDIGVHSYRISDQDYIDYLCHYCNYKDRSDFDKTEDIRHELRNITRHEYYYNSKKKIFIMNKEETEENNTSTTINDVLEKDRTHDSNYVYDLTAPDVTQTRTYSHST